MSDRPAIVEERDGSFLTLRLSRPETRNALTAEMSGALKDALSRASADDSLRAVIVEGKGDVFCAGGDLKAFATLAQQDRQAIRSVSLDGAELFDAMATCPHVTITVLKGAAMAGGLGLAACADFVLARSDTKMAFSEVRLGLIPAQIAPHVVRRCGSVRAKQLLLQAHVFDADHAMACGLVDKSCGSDDDLAAALDALKADLTKAAPGALKATKAWLNTIGEGDDHDLPRAAAERFADAVFSNEGREGLAAFLEKRPPRWQG